jgi:hypothetical protein
MPDDDTHVGNGTPDYWAGVRQGRMMTRIDSCACTFDEDGNGPLNICGAHKEWADDLIKAEREVCAKIADEWGQRKDQMTDTAFMPGADHGERFASSGIAGRIRARSNLSATPSADTPTG